MKNKQLVTQLTLVSIGLLLFILTYIFYPNLENKKQTLKNETLTDNIEKSDKDEKATYFENLEYQGLYDLNKPFKVKSSKAYILDEDPNIVYMNKMHVILYLTDGRVVNIVSDKGIYNKKTYDCFFEQNVRATDESTKISAENLDFLATKNFVEIYNNVSLDYAAGFLEADKINYNFETKNFKVSMFDDRRIKMKVIR